MVLTITSTVVHDQKITTKLFYVSKKLPWFNKIFWTFFRPFGKYLWYRALAVCLVIFHHHACSVKYMQKQPLEVLREKSYS